MALKLVVWVSGQAGEAGRAFQALKKHQEPVARNAVVLVRDVDGKVFVFESGNVDYRHWPLLGASVGLLVERLGRPEPEGAPADYVTAIRASFQPGGSALVFLVDSEQVEGVLGLLAAFRGQGWQQALADMLLARLAAAISAEGR
jgi:uncharacterized membrane protein